MWARLDFDLSRPWRLVARSRHGRNLRCLDLNRFIPIQKSIRQTCRSKICHPAFQIGAILESEVLHCCHGEVRFLFPKGGDHGAGLLNAPKTHQNSGEGKRAHSNEDAQAMWDRVAAHC